MSKINTAILNSEEVNQKLIRLSWQLYENNIDQQQLLIAGISERGYLLAEQICNHLRNISSIKIDLVKITLNKENPSADTTILDQDITSFANTPVVLVDDVLNSGRTMLYALSPLIRNKHPEISILVLVDRNHRRFPVHANYVGISLATTMQEHVEVSLQSNGFEVTLH